MTRQIRRTDAEKIMPILIPVLGEKLAAAIIDFRDNVKKEPLTEYAAELQVKQYLLTGNPIAAAEMQILRSWRSIKADWFFNEIQKEQRTSSRSKPLSPFMQEQADIKRQLERNIYGESDEFTGSTIDVATANYRAH